MPKEREGMKTMQVRVKAGQTETEATEALVLILCEGASLSEQGAASLDKAMGGALTDLIKSKEFEGKLSELALLHTQGKIPAKRVLLVGIGKKASVGLDTIRQAMGHAAKRVRQAKAASFTALIPTVIPRDSSAIEVAQAMAEGAVLGTYQFNIYRSEGAPGKDLEQMTILAPQKSQLSDLSEGIRRGTATAEATVFVRDLCNHPSNVMTPTKIAQEAKAIAKETGVSLKILEQKDMEKLGMGALLGVARGSQEPPKLDRKSTRLNSSH
jgi:leucyl aminopeptidase